MGGCAAKFLGEAHAIAKPQVWVIVGASDSHSRIQDSRAGLGLLLHVVVAVEVVVVMEVLVLLGQTSRPDEPTNISVLSAVEVTHTPQSVCANDEAE